MATMIYVSDVAEKHIRRMLAKRGKGIGIRVGIKTTGCSGLAYVLEYVDTPDVVDQEFKCGDVSVFVNPKHLVYIDGMTVDFVRNGLNEGFEFRNPREKDRCGCGESFRV